MNEAERGKTDAQETCFGRFFSFRISRKRYFPEEMRPKAAEISILWISLGLTC